MAILRKLPLLGTKLVNPDHLHEFGKKEIVSAVEICYSIEQSLGLCCVDARRRYRKSHSRRLGSISYEVWRLLRYVNRELLGRCPRCKLSSLAKDFETLPLSNHFVIATSDEESKYYRNIILVGNAEG